MNGRRSQIDIPEVYDKSQSAQEEEEKKVQEIDLVSDYERLD